MKIHEQITEDTWCQNVPVKENKMCLVRWVQHIYKEKYWPTLYKISVYVKCSTVAWNDHPGRKFAEVKKLCEFLDI